MICLRHGNVVVPWRLHETRADLVDCLDVFQSGNADFVWGDANHGSIGFVQRLDVLSLLEEDSRGVEVRQAAEAIEPWAGNGV